MGAEIVSTFTTAFTDLCSGVAGGVVDTFNTVFMTTDGKLSNLAIWGIVFGAVGLGLAIIRKFTAKAG